MASHYQGALLQVVRLRLSRALQVAVDFLGQRWQNGSGKCRQQYGWFLREGADVQKPSDPGPDATRDRE